MIPIDRWVVRGDPGPCPICGAPHTSCTGDDGTIRVVQPGAAAAREPPAPVPTTQTETFSTKTYRGRRGKT